MDNIKSIQKWFEQHVFEDNKPFTVDDEQASAILDDHKNILVTARAGSGKTRTIVAKVVYLICHEYVDPKEIVIFAFNRDARDELNRRLHSIKYDNKNVISSNIDIASTFHSFARQSIDFSGSVISDECKTIGPISDRELYIRTLLRKMDAKRTMNFIRNQTEPTKKNDEDLREYVKRLRNTTYDTLDGRVVRSFTEKIIADYLFEHDINYENEISYYPNSMVAYAKPDSKERLSEYDEIKPDFYLTDYDLAWENWGISGAETRDEIEKINSAKIFSGGYYGYKHKKDWKEWFYSKKWIDSSLTFDENTKKTFLTFSKCKDLIETYRHPSTKREKFEENIRNVLSGYGVDGKKLPENEIVEKFEKNEAIYEHLAKLVGQFIDRAEQCFFGHYDELRNLCEKETDAEVKDFYDIACNVLEKYHEELFKNRSNLPQNLSIQELFSKKQYVTDFNIMLGEGSKAISSGANCKTFDVDNLQYIFVDEYQDMSPLFYDLIAAIRGRCPDAKMMGVGDDWQAINGFAGSNLRYFRDFETYFPEDVARLKISTNYRSNESIVQLSNDFMRSALNEHDGAVAKQLGKSEDDLNDVIVKKVYGGGKAQRKRRAYREAIAEIINDNLDKTIRIINREKKIPVLNENIYTLKGLLDSVFKRMLKEKNYDSNNITSETAHKSKGLQADVIILLDGSATDFPIIHPDTKYFGVFGDDVNTILDEEKRLFYVALTRAKEKIYIVKDFSYSDEDNEENEPDDFFKMIESDNFCEITASGLSMKRLIEKKDEYIIPTKIGFKPYPDRPGKVRIIVETSLGDEVCSFNEDKDGPIVKSLRKLADELDKEAKTGKISLRRLHVRVNTSQDGRKFIHFDPFV